MLLVLIKFVLFLKKTNKFVYFHLQLVLFVHFYQLNPNVVLEQ